jgi:hypothetical protein
MQEITQTARRFVPSDAPPPGDPDYDRVTDEMSLAEITAALCDGGVSAEDD